MNLLMSCLFGRCPSPYTYSLFQVSNTSESNGIKNIISFMDDIQIGDKK